MAPRLRESQSRALSKTKKNGVSEVSANQGCALTKRASARNPSVEPNSFRLRNSVCLWLTQKRDLLAKTLQIYRRGFSQGSKVPGLTCLYRVAHHTGGRSFSVSPMAGALLVYSVTQGWPAGSRLSDRFPIKARSGPWKRLIPTRFAPTPRSHRNNRVTSRAGWVG
jgi:hypothetical protein